VIRIAVMCAVLVGAAGCPKEPIITREPGGGQTRGDPPPSLDDLRRDLEATVLENYLQLTLGNLDAYAEAFSRSREVALFGIAADQVVVSERPGREQGDRRLFRDASPTIYTKTLDVHLTRNGALGWIFDEVSYRVPFRGREASIPVRVTAGFVRDIDRWAMVFEHLSYALPTEDLLRMAQNGALATPAPIEDRGAHPQLDRMFVRAVERLHNGPERLRQRSLADDPDVLVIYPAPEHEFHGAAAREAPLLAEVYGTGGTVAVAGRRITVARTGRAAWLVANLEVTTTVNGDPLRFGLRGTYVLELRGELGWEIVQAHVSVPVPENVVCRRVFGPGGAPWCPAVTAGN
jgi:ketosteroid isomerase-like protein